MKRISIASLVFVSLLVSFVTLAQEPAPVATTNRVWLPKSDIFAHFTPRAKMRAVPPGTPTFNAKGMRAVKLPIDWAKSFVFPMLLNDQYGDCYYAAACHADQTWQANSSTISVFSLSAVRTRYLALSHGDNGLSDNDIIGEWKGRGLADVPSAKIVDALLVDYKDANAVQTAMDNFGAVMFTLAIPDSWLQQTATGSVWNAPATPNQNNGHAVIFNGVDTAGKYKIQTWGTNLWITHAGVQVCNPETWVAFTTRWFNSAGYAPNGLHITDAAALWVSAGGRKIPQSIVTSFPPKTPPSTVTLTHITEWYSDGTSKKYPVGPMVP